MYNNQPPNYNQPPVVQYIQPAPVMYAPPVEMVAPPMGDPLIDGLSYFPALVVKQKTNSFWEYLCNCEEENVSFTSLLYLVFPSLFAPSPSIVYCLLFRFIISFDLCKKYTIFNPMGDNKESMNPSHFIIVPYPTCSSFLHFLPLAFSPHFLLSLPFSYFPSTEILVAKEKSSYCTRMCLAEKRHFHMAIKTNDDQEALYFEVNCE